MITNNLPVNQPIFKRISLNKRFFVLCLILNFKCIFAQFSLGNLVVLQLGNGAGTLTNTGNPLIFKEYSPTGTLTFSVAVPSTGSNALLLRGSAASEGYISRSADQNNLVFGAYLASYGTNNFILNSATASNVNRCIGVINTAGVFSIGANGNSMFTGNDIRGAAATNSNNLWATSSAQGTGYFGTAAAATNVANSKTNVRAAMVFNNQLYISSQVATGTPSVIGVYAIGSGTPVTSAQTVSTVINTGTGSVPGQFYFSPNGLICYVADARAQASGGGIQKWVYGFSSGNWNLAYTLPTGTTSAGAFGVVADFSGFNPKIYATTSDASLNRLIAILDTGPASTATTLVTAGANTVFRGLAFSPVASTCVPAAIVNTSNNAPICSSQGLAFNVSASGSSPITYTWMGQGAFSSTSVANPSITNSASGAYTVLLSNACGSASTAIHVSINPSPTLQVNSMSICAGGTATLNAAGADTYTWSTGNNTATFTISPLATTVYTLNGTSFAGCAANTATASVTLIPSLVITATSHTVCAGSTATVVVSGASTYTWSNNLNTTTIAVNPALSTTYTVSGNAPGCPLTASTTATVIVNPLPALSLSMDGDVFCLPQTSVTLNGSPAGGVFSGPFVNGSVFSPTATGNYSVSYSYTDLNTCSNVTSVSLNVSHCEGLDDTDQINAIKIFPNPAHNSLSIQLKEYNNRVLSIYTVYGQKIMNIIPEHDLISVDIICLPVGIYYIEISATITGRIKFIKE